MDNLKNTLSITASLIGAIASFVALFQFFTGARQLSDLKNIITSVPKTTTTSSFTPGEDPNKAYLNINCSTDSSNKSQDLSCQIKTNGKLIGNSPIEGYEIQPGIDRIVISRKGFITEIFDYSIPSGSSAAITVKVFPNSEEGVMNRTEYLKYLSLTSNIKGLKGIVRTINIALFVGFLILIIISLNLGVDSKIGLFLVGTALFYLISILIAPLCVEFLLIFFKDRILTIVTSSLIPIIIGIILSVNKE